MIGLSLQMAPEKPLNSVTFVTLTGTSARAPALAFRALFA